MPGTARLFNCVLCRCQVVICRACDRCNIYCAGSCSRQSCQERQRQANRRYQNTPKGRSRHADRQRRYRSHRNKVTYQRSVELAPDAVLPVIPEQVIATEAALLLVDSAVPAGRHGAVGCCSFCGISCSDFVRRGFLRHGRDRFMTKPVRRGLRRGHFP